MFTQWPSAAVQLSRSFMNRIVIDQLELVVQRSKRSEIPRAAP